MLLGKKYKIYGLMQHFQKKKKEKAAKRELRKSLMQSN